MRSLLPRFLFFILSLKAEKHILDVYVFRFAVKILEFGEWGGVRWVVLNSGFWVPSF